MYTPIHFALFINVEHDEHRIITAVYGVGPVRYSYSIPRHYCSALQKQSSSAHDNRPYCAATPHPNLSATELAYNYRIYSRG
jgi:hypothetical protein